MRRVQCAFASRRAHGGGGGDFRDSVTRINGAGAGTHIGGFGEVGGRCTYVHTLDPRVRAAFALDACGLVADADAFVVKVW